MEEPVVKVSDRIVALIGNMVLCWFVHEGEVYRFETVIRKSLGEGLTLLEYPSRFQVEVLRKYVRIRVNLEVEFSVAVRNLSFRGTVADISEGGCQIHVDGIAFIGKSDVLVLSFMLPDNQLVKAIEGVVKNVEHDRAKKRTTVGVQFRGPSSELGKISSFCQFCQYFKV